MSKNVESSLKEAGSKVDEMIDQVKDQAQEVVDQAKEKLQERGYLHNSDEFRNQVHQQFEDFVKMGEDEFARLYGSNSKIDNVINFVRDRPVVTLVLTFVTGFILFKVLKCCCRRHNHRCK